MLIVRVVQQVQSSLAKVYCTVQTANTATKQERIQCAETTIGICRPVNPNLRLTLMSTLRRCGRVLFACIFLVEVVGLEPLIRDSGTQRRAKYA